MQSGTGWPSASVTRPETAVLFFGVYTSRRPVAGASTGEPSGTGAE